MCEGSAAAIAPQEPGRAPLAYPRLVRPVVRLGGVVEHEAVADRVAGPLRVTRERLRGGVEVERAHPETERHRADRRAHGVERVVREARRELAARLGMLRGVRVPVAGGGLPAL